MKMKKSILTVIVIILFSILASGCDNATSQDIQGTWMFTALEDYNTGEDLEFDQDVYIFNKDGTGIELYLPCSYYERLSYIAWYQSPNSKDIVIQHSEDFSYPITIIDISDDHMMFSYYSDDYDDLLLATYQRVSQDMSPFIGAWYLYEVYEEDELVERNNELLSFYPNNDLFLQYWIDDKEYPQEGSWMINDGMVRLNLKDDAGKSTIYEYKYYMQGNTFEMTLTTEDLSEVTYVYKRSFGSITNSPPATTSAPSVFEQFYEYISSILDRLKDEIRND